MKVWIVVLVALAIRIFQVASLPPSLSWDEVSIGYNAYSILKTGRDEHGRLFPVDAFIAYGDYKPPLSVYATVPFVALFGLNEFSVRLPSVFAGTATVALTYFLVLELFRKKRGLALLSAGLLAASPWHILLSRAGFEANIAVMFMVLGALLLLRSRTNPKLLWWAYLPFVAGIYTFNSARYFGPLLALGLTFYLRRTIGEQKKHFIIGVVIAALCMLPILPHLISPEARLRLAEVNIFSDLPLVTQANERMAVDGNSWWANIVHNRRVAFARSYLLHFFDHLQPSFLFIRGDGNPKFSIQDVGQMYLVEAPFLVFGVLWLFAHAPGIAWLLIFWLVAAIAPAAIAKETPHALRIENSLPVWQIFTAVGIWEVFSRRKKLWAVLFAVLFAVNVAYFAHNYFTHYAKEFSGEWQYGYKQAIEKIAALPDTYDTIVVSDVIGRPYMYTLFYTKYDPAEFLRIRDSYFDAAGFYHVAGFGPWRFPEEGKGDLSSYEGRTLYVTEPSEVVEGATVVDTVNLLNGNPVLVLFEI